MIDPDHLGLIELLLTGGIVLGFGFWQLWSVRKELPWELPWRKRRDSTRDPGHPEG